MRDGGLDEGLNYDKVPSPSRKFMKHTFEVINAGRPHEVAASFALARESVIPLMFKRILKLTKVSKEDAPVFHYYLERHAELDGDHHGPMANRILEELCRGRPQKEQEVIAQAKQHRGQDFLLGRSFACNGSSPIARFFTRIHILDKFDFHRELVPGRRGNHFHGFVFRGVRRGHPWLNAVKGGVFFAPCNETTASTCLGSAHFAYSDCLFPV